MRQRVAGHLIRAADRGTQIAYGLTGGRLGERQLRYRILLHTTGRYEERLPEPLYALRRYEHPKVTRPYFGAQRALQPLQGHDQVWLAGMYTHDVDCHESAVVSAVRVAEQLAPGTEQLRLLTGPALAAEAPARARQRKLAARRGER